MKCTIEQPKLQALLSRVTGTVERRVTIPILGHVLLSTDDGNLSARATDLDTEVTSKAEATIEQHGATTVSAALLSAIVGKMSKGALIAIAASDGRVTVSNGKASFDLSELPPEDFPELASAKYDADFTADGNELKALFDATAFAMSSEETRYYLNGVYLHPHEGKVRAVATDGHRLAVVDSGAEAEFPGVIVPRKVVGEIRKLLGDGEVKVSASETKIRFDMGHTVVVSKVVDGTFPDYLRVIPTARDFVIDADAVDMKSAADLVALVSGERTKSVKLSVSGDQCTLQVNGGSDTAREAVTVEAEGGDSSVAFNAKYFAEAMGQCNGGRVKLAFGGDMTPVRIEPQDDPGALFVVMPLRA